MCVCTLSQRRWNVCLGMSNVFLPAWYTISPVRFNETDPNTHTHREKKELGVRERRVSGGGCGSADGGEENQPRCSKHCKSHREVACRLLLVNAKLERQSATAFFRCEQVSLMDDVVT